MEEKEFDFEKELNKLKEIVAKVQSGDCSLSENVKLYEEGQKIIDTLTKELEKSKEKVENIVNINKK